MIILKTVLALLLMAFTIHASGATYYVRTDGGTNVQCNGTADAPASAAPNCAWSSLMEALPPVLNGTTHPALIKGGDTLVIDAGTYRIGWADGLQARWGDPCAALYAPACTLQPVPSGTATNPTRIVGAGWDSGCDAPPALYGADGVNQVLNLTKSSHVVIACLDLTDHAYCTLGYRPDSSHACNHTWASTSPPAYGDWGQRGIYASDSDDVTLQDVAIHGFADMGVQAGRISNWTVTRVTVAGNGNVGWNGDLGGNGSNSKNSGNLTFTDLTVKWNGCQEHYPPDGGFDLCYGQEQGGYGDGLGEALTGGVWTFVRPKFYRNTSDGLDLLYLDGTGSVTVDHGYFARNVGNDLKTAGNATITNSVFIAQCSVFKGTSQPVAPNPCRAGGGEFFDFTAPNQTLTFANNTVAGEAGCLIGGDPVGTSQTGGAALDATDVYDIHNSIFVVGNKWNGDGKSCLFWAGDPPNNPATINWSNNLVWPQPRESGRCTTAGITCVDPQLTDESLPTFNPVPKAGSPAWGANAGAQP
jgi:hypothetical protein